MLKMKAASEWLVTETREGSSGEHFVLPSGWLLWLLGFNFFSFLGRAREQVRCSEESQIERIHVQLNKQLEVEQLPAAQLRAKKKEKRWMKIAM